MSLSNTVFPRRVLEVVASRPQVTEDPVARPRSQAKPSLPSRIAVIGNYLPRQCGIATFTTDLCGAIAAEYGTARLLALQPNLSAAELKAQLVSVAKPQSGSRYGLIEDPLVHFQAK